MRQALRIVSTTAAVVGLLVVGWVGYTLWRGDPVTGYLQSRAQADLRRSLAVETVAQTSSHKPSSSTRRLDCRPGRHGAIGVLTIPKIDVSQVVLQGTGANELSQGPGHYPSTGFPGSGRTIAIAGHRTTWGAPFRHVDDLRHGDRLTFCGVPYEVQTVIIVAYNNWGVIRARRRGEWLLLTACHPLYSAAQRIVVLSKRITP